MKFKKCKAPNCNRKAVSKEFCDAHYRRFIKYGTYENLGKRNVAIGDCVERFHQKYKINSETGCWEWTGSFRLAGNKKKYGRHFDNNKTISAHRFSYTLYNGELKEGYFVCHKCDNTLCVNPKHLFMGTHKQNMEDMVNKNRASKRNGEKHHLAKLKNKQVIEIRKSKKLRNELSKIYGVSQTTIRRILMHESYQNA